MNATDLYTAGRLRDAIEAQIEEVKGRPTEQGKRLFLFELFLFAGELERGRRQIEAIQYRDTELDLAVMAYRKLLDAEQSRRDLFTQGLTPGFFGEPSEQLQLRLEAANQLREDQSGEASESLSRANEAMPPIRGRLNGQSFESLRDADDLFAGVLEVMAHGRYFWVGLEQVRLVTMKPPRFPRDLLFIPAHLELEDEAGEVFLPALYPGSYEHPDDQVKLGRMTDWKVHDGGLALGAGLHTYLRDEDALSLLEWRELRAGEG
jgi:type VI secretion system protein ImpE